VSDEDAVQSGGSVSATRTFLFLQGVCSPFFARLADALRSEGHRVFKVNFNGGDVAYWGGRSCWSYRGRVEGLHGYLDERYRKFAITDQILFGDRRPVHLSAIHQAKQRGIRTHVFEEGYFRPFWLTLERDGVNGHSRLPRDPGWFLEVGAQLPDRGEGEPFASPFRMRAMHDLAYHAASALNPILFPLYRTHAPDIALIEYAAYVRRFSRLRLRERRDLRTVTGLLGGSTPYFLLPLQLNSDAQIRDHSQFADMCGVMALVMDSFARHAPSQARLVIKNHPLDTGLVNYASIILEMEKRFGISGRIDYLESGDLMGLLDRARGVVTVNSTVGGLSLARQCPTTTLGDPIYNLPGLTFQGHLDDFWTNDERPDAELFRRFRNTVIHTTQVNGGLYCGRGIELAVGNCVRRLVAERSLLEELL
jgi:capsular polysaccharide export protein